MRDSTLGSFGLTADGDQGPASFLELFGYHRSPGRDRQHDSKANSHQSTDADPDWRDAVQDTDLPESQAYPEYHKDVADEKQVGESQWRSPGGGLLVARSRAISLGVNLRCGYVSRAIPQGLIQSCKTRAI